MAGLRIALGAHWVQVVMIKTGWDIQSNAILAAWLNAIDVFTGGSNQ